MLLGDAAQDRQQPLDDHGREPEAHLVDQQQPRRADQRTADGEHLLLAARQHAGLAVEALLSSGSSSSSCSRARLPLRRGELQVLAHGHAEEQRAALGDERHAAARELVGGDAGDVARRRA